MSNTRDIRNFFKTSNNKIPPFVTSASGSLNQAEIHAISEEVKSSVQTRKHYNTSVPERIKIEVGEYALINGTKSALEKFNTKYPQYTFIRTSVNNWKKKIENNKKQNISTTIAKKGRPNLLDDETLAKVRDGITGIRMTGGVISRKMVIAIGNGIIKANSPTSLKEFGGHIELTEGWARNVLKSMKWTKRKGTTGKVEPSQQFLAEEKLTFQRNISSIIKDHDIPKDLILNLDQTPLSYVSPGKYTFNPIGAKTVPIKGIDDKRQITATFSVSMTGTFLPIQLIYEGKTRRCLPNYDFPNGFNVTYSPNHWSNTEKSVELFQKIIFPYFKTVKSSKKYPKEQMSLIIMDTFKGQENDIVLDLCKKHFCQVVIVPHNLTNKFQPLDITVNKPAKSFISNLYNEWFAEQVTKQIRNGIPPADIQVSLNLGELKVMHARWISSLYHYLCDRKEIILNGYEAAGITEAVESATAILQRVENPFRK